MMSLKQHREWKMDMRFGTWNRMDLRETGQEGGDWIQLVAEDRD
jgi:hypothetical protein